MSQWLNTDNFVGGMISGLDPIVGDKSPTSSVFTLPTSPTSSVKVLASNDSSSRGARLLFSPEHHWPAVYRLNRDKRIPDSAISAPDYER
jgi:hypothetical protein